MHRKKPLITVDLGKTFLADDQKLHALIKKGRTILDHLREGKSKEHTGWLTYPASFSNNHLQEINEVASSIASTCECIVVVGVGGSYLGAKTVIDSLKPYFRAKTKSPELLFAGTCLSGEYTEQLLHYLQDRSFGVVVVSKSGSTLETMLTFHLLENLIYTQYGTEEAKRRIVVVTDPEKGTLRIIANKKGYRSLPIPRNIGGRFSVLTPAGLLPIAIAGIDVRKLIEGATKTQEQLLDSNLSPNENPAILYAASRQFLYQEKAKKIELLASFDPKLSKIGEWWQQLFAESEGKEGKGLFIATSSFTTDLHSVGQWIQQGERTIFETLLTTEKDPSKLQIPTIRGNEDPLSFLSKIPFSYLTHCAEKGTIEAHNSGGVPIITISIAEKDAFHIGALLYFFELAVAISGKLMEVNPFDQPGVETYKEQMYALLRNARNENPTNPRKE